MHQLLEEGLAAIYPEFLSGSDFGTHFSSCCCESGDGWYPLLASLFTQLGALSKQSGTRFAARQIKEKFGTLRVYFASTLGFDSEAATIAEHLVDVAELLSGGLCEQCGAPAKSISIQGWIKTVCPLHTSSPSIYTNNSDLVARLLEAPRPKLDLSSLPLVGRIERFSSARKMDCKLKLIRYRSMEDYSAARLSDIEICEEVGWYGNYEDAREAAERLHCEWFVSRVFSTSDEIQPGGK